MAGLLGGAVLLLLSAGTRATGVEAAGVRPAGDVTSRVGPAGDVTAGLRPAGDVTAGLRPAGDVTAGLRPAGDVTAGLRPAGDVTAGAGPAGAIAPGAAAEAEAAAGHWRRVEEALLDGSAHAKGLVTEGDQLALPGDKEPNGLRNAEADPSKLWPNKEVPIALAEGEWSPAEREKLFLALDDLMESSCVRFVPRTVQEDYLLLRNVGHQCASVVGYHRGAGGVPTFLGGRGCHRRGTVQHEMLHNLGIWHEHTRPDRDQHVTVLWKHIAPGREFNFLTRPTHNVKTLGLPYDYASVMHYRAIAFSKDGFPTLIPARSDALEVLGQRIRFSPLDIAKINVLYDCPAPYYRGDK